MIGFLNIYKPSGITSFAVVNKIKKLLNIKKVGHMGTLDPMACGVLPIAIGKATRLFDYSLQKDKTYRVIFEFGYSTNTLDSDGEVIVRDNKLPSIVDISNVLPKMIGKCNQVPPNFSAKKVNGVRAYDLAREGVEFELKPKEIEIYNMDLIKQIDESKFEFIISCSSGTYIRSIGRDLAYLLNMNACMVFLERVESGIFCLDNSVKLEDINESNFDKFLISPLLVFKSFDRISIDAKTYKDLLDGKKIKQSVISDSFILHGNKLIGIAKKNDDYLKLDTYLEE